MIKLLGANWQTTLWGWITILAGAIVVDPTVISFLPDPSEPWIIGFSKLIAIVAGGTFAYQVKSKNVTGGTVQQTATGAVAPTTSTSVQETKEATIK